MSKRLRHIVVFKLYEDADKNAVMASLRELGADEPNVLEWNIYESLDSRKGVILIENGLFESPETLAAFRANGKHDKVTDLLSKSCDWLTADYLE